MKLLSKLRRSHDDSEPEFPVADHTQRVRDPESNDPLAADPSAVAGDDREQRTKRRSLSRLLPRRRAGQPEGHDPAGQPTRSQLLEEPPELSSQQHSNNTELHELLAAGSASTDHDEARSLIGDQDELDSTDQAHKEEAEPIAFDSRASTIFEPVFRWLLVAALVSFVILATFFILKLYQSVNSSEDANEAQGANQVAAGAASATPPTRRAAEFAEEFASAYLSFPASDEGAADDYMASLQPYLHPSADKELFRPQTGDGATAKEATYVSTHTVEEAPGEDRYRVVVNARLRDAVTGEGEGQQQSATSLALTMTLRVPQAGSGAYVVAPPRVTEPIAQTDPGSPGIYGYPEAKPLEDPHLQKTLQEFFGTAYGPTDERALVDQQLADGPSVNTFPPQEYSFEGIERAAVYYRDNPEQAEASGYAFLYDVEVYLRVTDENSGTETLDAWALTVGEREEGGYEITAVG